MTTSTSLSLPQGAVAPATGLSYGLSYREHRGEDRLVTDAATGLFAVFDGVGGHGDGATAARIAADVVRDHVRAHLPDCQHVDELQGMLVDALQAADAAIGQHDAARRDAGAPPSGTTASVVLVCDARVGQWSRLLALVANVGDSRVHLVRAGQLTTITLDHSFLGDPDVDEAKARQDRLDAAEGLAALADPVDRVLFTRRHLLAHALTGDADLDVRQYVVELAPGDRLAIDSDGIHDNLMASELVAALWPARDAQAAAEATADAAWRRSQETGERSKPDDLTIVVVEPPPGDAAAAGPGGYRLAPGGMVTLPLDVPDRQYLVAAADFELVVCRCGERWEAAQPAALTSESTQSITKDGRCLGRWVLSAEPVEFGRATPGNFLSPPSRKVSRRHVSLALGAHGDALVVQDLCSTNGTTVIGW